MSTAAPWPTEAEASELDVQRQAWPDGASSLHEAMVARIMPQVVRRERRAAARALRDAATWVEAYDAAEDAMILDPDEIDRDHTSLPVNVWLRNRAQRIERGGS